MKQEITNYFKENPELVFPLLLIIYFTFTLLGLWLIARGGWKKFSNNYASLNESMYSDTAVQYVHVGNTKYKNGVLLKTNEKGLLFKKPFHTRFAHPTFHIPYSDIERVEHHTFQKINLTTLFLKDTSLPTLKIDTTTYEYILAHYQLVI